MLEIDDYILQTRNTLSPLPRADPSRSTNLTTLAVAQLARYELTDEDEDLDGSISHSVGAILSFDPQIGRGSDVVTAFFFLADSLFRRSDKLKRLDDSKHCVGYFRYLRDQSLETSLITRDRITTAFTEALANRVQMGSIDPTRNIEEMAILCRELLSLDASDELLLGAAETLVKAIDDEHFSAVSSQPPPDQAIECLREANIRFPDSEIVSLHLVFSFFQRFILTHSHTDYEDAMSIVDRSLTHPLPRYVKLVSTAAVGLAVSRFEFYGNPEYLEEAIFRIRTHLRTASSEDPDHEEMTRLLERLEKSRFHEFNITSNLPAMDFGSAVSSEDRERQEMTRFLEQLERSESALDEFTVTRKLPAADASTAASSEDPDFQEMLCLLEILGNNSFDGFTVTRKVPAADEGNSEDNNHPSPSHQVSSLPITRSDIGKVTRMTQDVDDPHGLETIFYHLEHATDRAEIEEAIKCCRRSLESTQSSDFLTVAINCYLACFLIRAFDWTDDMAHLNESITLFHDILKRPATSFTRLNIIRGLHSALITRFYRSREMVDADEMMRLFPIAAADACAKIPDRFNVSCQWANLARYLGHPSTSTAYEKAISFMKESLAFGPTLEIQHHRLVLRRVDYETLPLDFASHQIDIGQLEQAVETLERGRGLLWSEMRGLHMSIDQLRLVDLPLAERFAAINNDLEALTTSSSAGIWPNEDQANSDELMEPIGRLVIKQRTLVTERDMLISQIQSHPGFGTFLMTPSFDILRSAAERRPVITINHTRWRSDTIILLRDVPPSLIPMPNNSYERATQLKDQLLSARKHGLDSGAYNDALSSALETLSDLVGRPVIQRLRDLNIPEQSRIWFCPTSVFCSLPLHAMGPIRSEGPVKLYFSDLYIPSYTPTLSALIESRKPRSRPLDRPSMLLVIQPDAKMPKALQEMRIIQSVGLSTATLLQETATPSAVLGHLRDYQFVHVSCHGNLETGKPFDAFFTLYGGARLTLLDIVRSRLATGEFAFLSACHTAELTTESIADEGLHLAGAVQYCGFRSVVGTMWGMADVDGPDLAGNFHRSVFSNRWEGMAYYERTAEALRDAVKVLRRKRNVTLERWVNFVHYGA